MAAKSLFDLKRGESASVEPAASGGAGGNESPAPGTGRAESGSETISVESAFGPSAAADLPDTDPDAPFGRFPDGTPRKRRARGTAGTGSTAAGRKSATEKKGDISGIESLLLTVHLMGAAYLQMPELALNPVEANKLAVALSKVQGHYPMVVSEKTQDLISLVAIGGMIYVPRIIKVINKTKKPKANKSPKVQTTEQAEENSPVFQGEPTPDYKGPMTPGQLFGTAYAGG